PPPPRPTPRRTSRSGNVDSGSPSISCRSSRGRTSPAARTWCSLIVHVRPLEGSWVGSVPSEGSASRGWWARQRPRLLLTGDGGVGFPGRRSPVSLSTFRGHEFPQTRQGPGVDDLGGGQP